MPAWPLDNAVASFLQAPRHLSISVSVVVQPRLKRTAPRVSAGETPMAARTWEGWTLPGVQAALLPAAANERLGEMNVFAGADERADPFWPADLVGRERQEVGAERVD